MLGRINGAVRFREPLSFHTSLRIGGPAEFFIMPQDLDDLRYALAFAEQEDLPLIVIGGGNNLLVSDRGLQAVVVKLQGILSRAEFSGDEVAVGAGMPLSTECRVTYTEVSPPGPSLLMRKTTVCCLASSPSRHTNQGRRTRRWHRTSRHQRSSSAACASRTSTSTRRKPSGANIEE